MKLWFEIQLMEIVGTIWEILSNNPILASITTAALLGIPPLALRLLAFNRISGKEYLLGHYFAYHPLDRGGIVAWEVEIDKTKRGRLVIRMQEQNPAAYEYAGQVCVRENYLYSSLEGKTHNTNAFLVLSTPFNRSNAMPGTSGILCGVTPDRDVTAVKFLVCRAPMQDIEVVNFFQKGTASRIKSDDPPFTELMKAIDNE